MDYIKLENVSDAVAVLTISSPATLNALNSVILKELDEAIDTLNAETKVLIITGEGKSFVAGADISEMQSLDEQQGYEFGKRGAMVFKKIEDLKIPVIAAVNGFALGGGCELAMACDIRIGSEKALFGQPEVKLGILPGFSGSVRLPKLVGQGMAKELIYTGRNVGAEEAKQIGLLNSVTTIEELMPTAIKLAETIANNAPLAVSYAKESINKNYDMSNSEAIELENQLFGKCFATTDQKEGMEAFLQKRKAGFKGE